MKAIRIFFRSIRDSFKSVGRNYSLSMASIICVTITLVIVSVSIILACNIEMATRSIEGEMSIVTYLSKTVKDDDIKNVESEIKSIEEVDKLEFISKEEMKHEMSSYDDAFNTVLSYLDENPLLDCYIVYVDDVKKIGEVADAISEIPNIETVKYGEGMVEEIVGAFDIIEKIVIGIVIALVVVTVFLISNTIKLTIFARKNEIEIMRLVGASNTAIKLPFFFEGLILGVIGSIIPVCVTIYGYVILYNTMNGYLFSEMLRLVEPYNFVFYVSLVLVAIGALVGMYGSTKAVRKYLKI